MPASKSALYEEDFYAWTREQAARLRRLAAERSNLPLDLEELAEEIEDLGSERRFAIESRLERIVEHLLKLRYSPASAPRAGWRRSVFVARVDIRRRMTTALRREIEADLADRYRIGRELAKEALVAHGEATAAAALPETCPWSLEQLLDPDFWPEPVGS